MTSRRRWKPDRSASATRGHTQLASKQQPRAQARTARKLHARRRSWSLAPHNFAPSRARHSPPSPPCGPPQKLAPTSTPAVIGRPLPPSKNVARRCSIHLKMQPRSATPFVALCAFSIDAARESRVAARPRMASPSRSRPSRSTSRMRGINRVKSSENTQSTARAADAVGCTTCFQIDRLMERIIGT